MSTASKVTSENVRKRKASNFFTPCIDLKSAIIQRLENGVSNVDLAKEFNILHSTISSFYKNKNEIKEKFEKKF